MHCDPAAIDAELLSEGLGVAIEPEVKLLVSTQAQLRHHGHLELEEAKFLCHLAASVDDAGL